MMELPPSPTAFASPAARCRASRRSPSASMRRPARATSRRGSTASRICSSIWCSRAPAGARRARSARLVEDVGGDLNASTDRELTAFYASLLAPDLAAWRRAARRPGPPAAFRARRISSSRRRSCCRSWPKRATRRPTSSSTISRRPPSRARRSAARCSATKPASTRSRVDDLHDWLRPAIIAPDRLILVAAGKLDHERLVDACRAAFGDMAPAARPTPEPARFVGGSRFERRQAATRRISRSPCPRRAGARRTLMPRNCSPTSSAAAPRRGCSSNCARSRASLIRSRPRRQNFAIADCSGPMSPARARRRRLGPAQRSSACLPRRSRRSSQRDLERARALAKAGMMMSLESCWGQASYLATRLLRDGRAGRAGGDRRAARRGDARRGPRRPARRCWPGRARCASVGAKLALAA